MPKSWLQIVNSIKSYLINTTLNSLTLFSKGNVRLTHLTNGFEVEPKARISEADTVENLTDP